MCVHQQDDQHAGLLRPVDERRFNRGQSVRKLHPVQFGRNPRADFGGQNPEQLRPKRVAVRHATTLQQFVFLDSVHS